MILRLTNAVIITQITLDLVMVKGREKNTDPAKGQY
jgi:hypothetical protein